MLATEMKSRQLLPVGAVILRKRNELKMSQEDLAHRSGLQRTYIYDVASASVCRNRRPLFRALPHHEAYQRKQSSNRRHAER